MVIKSASIFLTGAISAAALILVVQGQTETVPLLSREVALTSSQAWFDSHVSEGSSVENLKCGIPYISRRLSRVETQVQCTFTGLGRTFTGMAVSYHGFDATMHFGADEHVKSISTDAMLNTMWKSTRKN